MQSQVSFSPAYFIHLELLFALPQIVVVVVTVVAVAADVVTFVGS